MKKKALMAEKKHEKKVPSVSIVVPVYKAERSLEVSINSVLIQSLKSIEVILVDDGSPDNSAIIADEIACRDQRVRVVHSEHGGPARASNLGIQAAKGDYIGFMDADDLVDEMMFEVLYKNAIETRSDIVMCGVVFEESKQKKTILHNPLENGVYDRAAIIENIILPMVGPDHQRIYSTPTHMLGSACRNIFRHQFLLQNNIIFPEEITYAEDILFCFRCYMECNTVSMIDQPFYHYLYQNSGSLSRAYRKNLFEMLIQVHDSLDQLIQRYGLESRCRVRLDARLLASTKESISNICKTDNEEDIINKMTRIYNIVSTTQIKDAYKNSRYENLKLKDRIVYLMIKFRWLIPLYLYYTTIYQLEYRRLALKEC